MVYEAEDSQEPSSLLSSSTSFVPATTITMTTETLTSKRMVGKSGNLDIFLGRSSSLLADPSSAIGIKHVSVQNSKRAKACPSGQEITALFAEIGRSCPNIETLQVVLDSTANRHGPAVALPVTALTSFFRQAPNHLVSLKLSGIISAEADQEFEDLERVIREKAPKTWKEVRLEFCEPSRGTPSLDPLLQAVSSSGSLQQVTLSGTNISHSNICTGPSLLTLLTENDLRVLTIWGGKRLLGKDDTLALVQALEEGNSSLKELTLHARGLCPKVGRALAHSLKANTTLQRLILSVSDTAKGQSSNPSNYVTTATLLADALRLHNRSLRLLSLDYCTEEEGALNTGDSLDYDFYEYRNIDVRASQWRNNVQEITKAFTTMLHNNPVLEVLWMNLDNRVQEDDKQEGQGGLLTNEMDMLLRLNRYGIRQRLFEGNLEATSQAWVKALESQKDDLNALYYLLSRSPSFCCSASARGTKRESLDLYQPPKQRRKTFP